MLSKPGGKPLFFHDTDSGTVLFAQRSGVVGVAEQAGIVSHDEGGVNIQKLLFFQIVVVTDTPGGKALVINLRKAHHTIAEVAWDALWRIAPMRSRTGRVETQCFASACVLGADQAG